MKPPKPPDTPLRWRVTLFLVILVVLTAWEPPHAAVYGIGAYCALLLPELWRDHA